MPDAIDLKVKGLDKLVKAFDKFPREITKNMAQAGEQAAEDVILKTKGTANYPPSTAANQPPTPYYIRGIGTQYATRNLGNSENMGKQWTVKSQGFNTKIDNAASYAKWVHGQDQARAMARIGWRKIFDVAKEKITPITKVYQRWVDKTIRRLGL
jgi:hypothetical protein